MLLLVLGAVLLLFCSLDVWYFVRGAFVFVKAFFQPRIWDILAVQSVDGKVLTHDLDYMGHMNNSRYLRECDFARFHHYMRNGIFMASYKLGAKMVIGASTIRYRRSLAFWEAFEIQTRIVSWDEKAFYLEQRFVSKKDGFVSAIMFCRQNVVHGSPEKIMELVCKRKIQCPEFPEELKYWMSFDSASSQALRAESGLLEKKNLEKCADISQAGLSTQGCVIRRVLLSGHKEPAGEIVCTTATVGVCGGPSGQM